MIFSMRVAHIEAGRHLYGGARQVLHLIGGLREKGVENTLLCARGAEIAAAARSLCEVIELPLRGDLDLAAARRMRQVLRAVKPDVVHVHSRRGADLFGGWASAGAPWRAVLTRRVDHREWPPWARWKYRPYQAVIAISRAVEAELLDRVGLPAARVHRVPSGVPPHTPLADATRPRRALAPALGLPRDARIAGVVAQLIPRKGHAVLLRALPPVLERHPRWHVVFFGRGPLEARLRNEIARAGLDGRVHLAGFLPDLGLHLHELECLLHPALREGLGLAVLEAMSAGVPVAASAVGGLPDVIESGISGLLVPPDDAAAWAMATERLMSDDDLRTRLGASGLARVQDVFSVREMVLGNLAVYRSVLGVPAPEARG